MRLWDAVQKQDAAKIPRKGKGRLDRALRESVTNIEQGVTKALRKSGKTVTKVMGRPAKFRNAAERQKAYRERKANA